MKDSLGDRMKSYEAVTKFHTQPKTYSVIRVDGRAFHSFTRGLERPFDVRLSAAMDETAVALCGEIQGSILAYVQSDEISVVFTDMQSDTSQPWFGGVVQKQASIAASVATAHFNQAASKWADKTALFDARVFTVPDISEAANYLLWRQKDAIRNSVSMVAQHHFPHKELQGVPVSGMLAKLEEKGILWDEVDSGFKYGRVAVRDSGVQKITYTDKRTNEVYTKDVRRSWWDSFPAELLDYESAVNLIRDNS